MRILVVDDDPELAELVSTSLTRDGHAVATAGSLAAARTALIDDFDMVVLDLGLPDGSGLALCRSLREAGRSTPILLLTAQSAVAQRVEGLNAGADDYVTKPFALAELRARVRALGRRRENPPVAFHERGDVRIDFSRRRAHRNELEVELTAREWVILETLAARRGRVVSRGRLLEEAWGEQTDSASASLEVLVGRISVTEVGREVVLRIDDAGPGLREEDRGRAFEPFFRAPEHRRAPGHGIGLALIAHIVSAHGGTVAFVDETPGSHLVVRLPLHVSC